MIILSFSNCVLLAKPNRNLGSEAKKISMIYQHGSIIFLFIKFERLLFIIVSEDFIIGSMFLRNKTVITKIRSGRALQKYGIFLKEKQKSRVSL